jgi:hypothetical protein
LAFAAAEADGESRSFLKETTKKLLEVGVSDPATVTANEQKSFASFLQKRRPFLFFLFLRQTSSCNTVANVTQAANGRHAAAAR